MLKRAVRWRVIQRNPVQDADRPRVNQPELNILTAAEIGRLWTAYHELEQSAASDEQQWWRLARTITFVALSTAMRRGELLALRWKDIRLLDGTLDVREALVKGRFTTPKSRASRRLLELGPQTQNLLSQHWQHTAFQGDDELVFCHPNKGTPLDPSKLARVYLRPALRHAGSTNSYDPSTTSATPHSPTKPPPATPWPTSSNAPATPTQRSPSATSTPHKSTSPAPPRAAKHTSSPHARTTQPLRNNRSLRIVEELDLPQETFGLQSRISRLENGAPVTLQDVVELNVGLGRNVLSGSGVPYVDTKPAGGDRSSA